MPNGLAEFIKARHNSPSDTDRLVRLLGPAQKYLAVKSQRVASVDLTAELMNGYASQGARGDSRAASG